MDSLRFWSLSFQVLSEEERETQAKRYFYYLSHLVFWGARGTLFSVALGYHTLFHLGFHQQNYEKRYLR